MGRVIRVPLSAFGPMAGSREGQKKTGPCCHCGVAESPMWRNGPGDKPNLCNACGARWLTHRTLKGYLPIQSGGCTKTKPKPPSKSALGTGQGEARQAEGLPVRRFGGEAAIGRLLWIWWGAPYNKYYKGVVIKFDRKTKLHLIAHHDGDVVWYKLAEEIVNDTGKRASAKVAPRKIKQAARPSPSASKSAKPSPYKGPRGEGAVGRSIGIWWEGDRKFYYGKILVYSTSCCPHFPPGHHFVHYDDGEGEWVNLDKELVDDFTSREEETSDTRQPPPPAPPTPAPPGGPRDGRLVLITPRRKREILPPPSPNPNPNPAATTSSVPSSAPVTAQQQAEALGKFVKLVPFKAALDEGLITQEDYDRAKEKVLSFLL